MNRCPSCFGQKQVKKLGFMTGDCDTCKGRGQLDDEALSKLATPPALPVSLNDSIAAATVAQNYKDESSDRKATLKHANVAFMNRPIDVDPKRKNDAASSQQSLKPAIQIPPGLKQAPDIRLQPKPLSPDSGEAIALRNATAEREDKIMSAQKGAYEDIQASIESSEASESQIEPKAKGKANGKKERKQAAN